MANLKKIIYLSEAQKDELFAQGSITSNNKTITYNENDIYVTPDKSIDTIQLNGTTYTSNNGTVNLGTTLVDDSDYVINSLVAPVEETSTASQLYNVGDLFIYNKQLYRATDTIATSATITPNTNCEALQLIEYIGEKANINNPVFTGSINMGRKSSTTVGSNSVAVGQDTEASGQNSIALGHNATASGMNSFSAGVGTEATGVGSYAEGTYTVASGSSSHAEGGYTVASGISSHAEGGFTIAAGNMSHVQGKYNISDNNNIYAQITGNGTSSARSNAYALTWTGDGKYAGNLYVGCNTDSTGGNKVATELYVSTAISNITIPTKVSDLTNDSGYLNPSDIANNLETTVAGKVLDARQGKTLDEKKIDKTYENPDDFTQKTWSGLASLPGCYIWTDGDNIYYSKDTYQYVLDKSTSTWNTKTWTWLTRFYGDYIWTDGDNIYYSKGTIQCVLNKSTSTWSNKTWNGMTDFDGNRIWTDGDNIYYSNGSTQDVLDKSTSTWSYKAWTGYTTVNGGGVWSDGDNIYYSSGSYQYVLNKSTSTWNTKTWTGLTNFSGAYIWTDGDNIYFSNDSNQYVLNKSTSTWSAKTWTGYTNIYGDCIWTDGENIYHNTASSSHVYNKKKDYVLLGSNGEFNSITLDSFISMIEDKITSASGVSF